MERSTLLNKTDLQAILASGFDIGFDDDDPDKHQFVHICHRHPGKALCGSPRLWFHGGPDEFARVDCQECIEQLRKRYVLELVEQALKLVDSAVELVGKREPEYPPLPNVESIALRDARALLEIVRLREQLRAEREAVVTAFDSLEASIAAEESEHH